MGKRTAMGGRPRQIAAETVRWLCAAAMILFVVGQFSSNKTSNTGFEEMSTAVMRNVSTEKLQLADNQMIKRLYGIDPSAYEQVLLYYPTTNMGAEELFLIKLSAPTSQQAEVRAAIEGRLATQKKSFDGYGTYQTAMLEASQIVVRGNYILFVSAENPDQIVRDFEAAL